jgi:O-antigen ligase
VSERLQRWSAYSLVTLMAMAVLVMFIMRLWINPSTFQMGLFVLGIGWAIAMVIRPFRLRYSFPMLPLACAIAWGLFQLAANGTASRADTRLAVLTWAGNLVAFSLARQVSESEPIRRAFLSALLSFAFILSLIALIQFFSADTRIFWLFPSDGAPALGPFVNHDQYAAFLEMLLPLALVRAIDGETGAIHFAIAAATMYASVIAGASRAGGVIATAEMVAVPILLARRGRMPAPRPRFAAAPVLLLALVFTAVVGCTSLWHRFQDRDPFQGRRAMLSGAVQMIAAKPWTGFGLGTFPTAYPAYGPVDFGSVVNHAHNDWAEWMADGGIPFALLLFSIVVWSLPRAWRSVWGIGLLAVFLHGLVDFPLQKPVLQLWLFGLLGALACEKTREDATEDPS